MAHEQSIEAAPRPNATDEAALAEKLGSRICHDLANPLMAISNGIELLELAGFGTRPEEDMLVQTVKEARARLDILRLAFGAGMDDSAQVAGRTVSQALLLMYRDRRLTPVWYPVSVPRARAKLALLLMMCADNGLPRGGTLDIRDTGGRITLSAAQATPRDIAPLWALLCGKPGAAVPTARDLHFALAAETARALGMAIKVDVGNQNLSISAA
ncbi:MAG: histidine phosphotransferase family protein [Pseudomonadota bacterium]